MIRVVIVDGFSSGKFLARELYDYGCVLLHVSSDPDIHEYYYKNFDYTIYSAFLTCQDYAETCQKISMFSPHYIIAGAESGVLLSDEFNRHFALGFSNDYNHSHARRNKYDMIQAISSAGLAAAKQLKTQEWMAAEWWIKHHNLFPVVLKPLASAGSDGVFICHNLTEAKAAFAQILGSQSKLNIVNKQVLIQEYLDGVEYVVNMVSLQGKTRVTEVVRYTKVRLESGRILYDIDDILDESFTHYWTLVDYTRQAIAALGIHNGPSHAEVMLTAQGPKLVEVAARTDGILRPEISARTAQLGQISATVMAITEPERFLALAESPSPYQLLNHSYNVCLINTHEGIFHQQDFITELQKLASFSQAVFYVDDDQSIGITQDVFSQPGTIYLVHSSKDVLRRDYRTIRQLEKQGIYLKKWS
ncbi:ATP-grasp domain-containing protein [Yersinia ruckeri]|uniref:ATP-grasp domain-containing protein n=1 Tax=Yersinia ruckeri TaxID=29486 RepID=UPI002237E493|nr:ATP-grasp domain-containing protein [Yersinia ruckeri]MCW6567019.1 ATP-grasp domain-containing protein [Yersinia ruckeri]